MNIRYFQSLNNSYTIVVDLDNGKKYQTSVNYKVDDEDIELLKHNMKIDKNYLKRNFNHIN
jgi:hypothetical protein